MLKNIDLLIIGAGPAGLACAIDLISRGISNILVLDKGKSYLNRNCNVDQGGICLNCKNGCNVISGFGGCVHYGDSAKLSKYPSGKMLYNLLGEERYNEYFNVVKDIIFGKENIRFKKTNVINKLKFDIKNYDIYIWNSAQIKRFIEKKFNELMTSKKILLNTEVISIDIVENHFSIKYKNNGNVYYFNATNVLVATGRSGFFWWRNELRKLNIKYTDPISSIGLRFELPKKYLCELGKQHPDLKLRFKDNIRKYKTFCFCGGLNGGRIKYENYGKFTLLDGHILTLMDIPSDVGNFALMAQLVNEKGMGIGFDFIFQKYIKQYIRLNNVHPGKPIYQSYYSFKNKCIDNPKGIISVKDAEPAEIWKLFEDDLHDRYCFISDKILRWLFSYSNNKNYFDFIRTVNVIGLEIEGIWDKIETEDNLMTSIPGLYVAGDCAGLSQGIVQAMISGVNVARSVDI